MSLKHLRLPTLARKPIAIVAALASVLLAASLLTACGGSSKSADPTSAASELNDHDTGSPYQGVGLIPPQPRPHFTLKNSAGQSYNFTTATAGKPTLLYFGYTNCPDVCPQTLADITNALLAVPSSLRAQTQVVFVTTDVKHDTGPVLAAYLSKFDTDLPNKFIGLYGTQPQIDAAQAAAHVTIAEDDGQTHSAQVLLYGSDDYAHVSFLQSDNESGQIEHDLKVVGGEK